eukprot:2745919-Prymnesium_polylepis.1
MLNTGVKVQVFTFTLHFWDLNFLGSGWDPKSWRVSEERNQELGAPCTEQLVYPVGAGSSFSSPGALSDEA